MSVVRSEHTAVHTVRLHACVRAASGLVFVAGPQPSVLSAPVMVSSFLLVDELIS
jgi:hypothetical protein